LSQDRKVAPRGAEPPPADGEESPGLPATEAQEPGEASESEESEAWVYVLRCRDGSLYTGAARDVDRRLRQHRSGQASRYTRSRLPVELAWSERVASWSEALRWEIRIKALSRKEKLRLISSGSPPGESAP
jgi:putative endonuclease